MAADELDRHITIHLSCCNSKFYLIQFDISLIKVYDIFNCILIIKDFFTPLIRNDKILLLHYYILKDTRSTKIGYFKRYTKYQYYEVWTE